MGNCMENPSQRGKLYSYIGFDINVEPKRFIIESNGLNAWERDEEPGIGSK